MQSFSHGRRPSPVETTAARRAAPGANRRQKPPSPPDAGNAPAEPPRTPRTPAAGGAQAALEDA